MQACSYDIGQLEILRQREAARARMGARFSLKAFHNAVLLGGDMPLAVMADLLRDTVNTRCVRASRREELSH